MHRPSIWITLDHAKAESDQSSKHERATLTLATLKPTGNRFTDSVVLALMN